MSFPVRLTVGSVLRVHTPHTRSHLWSHSSIQIKDSIWWVTHEPEFTLSNGDFQAMSAEYPQPYCFRQWDLEFFMTILHIRPLPKTPIEIGQIWESAVPLDDKTCHIENTRYDHNGIISYLAQCTKTSDRGWLCEKTLRANYNPLL